MSVQQGRRAMPRAGRKGRIVQWPNERPPIFTLSRQELNEYSVPTFHASTGKGYLL
jgi:hypothetical protein